MNAVKGVQYGHLRSAGVRGGPREGCASARLHMAGGGIPQADLQVQGHVTRFKTEPLVAETAEGARGMGRKFCLNCARRVRASVLVELCSDWDVPGGGRDGVPVWNPRRMAKVWTIKGGR